MAATSCDGLDPLAIFADETGWRRLPPSDGIIVLRKIAGIAFILANPTVCFAGRYGGAPALQSFSAVYVDAFGESKSGAGDKQTNAGMLRERFNYHCEKSGQVGSTKIISTL